jgi:hypothetical protein
MENKTALKDHDYLLGEGAVDDIEVLQRLVQLG